MDAFLQHVRSLTGKVPLQLEALKNISTDHNNWVIPGYLMAGPYPGVDGLNYVSDEAACKNLQGILQDGIDVFVSLCDELPQQDEQQPGSTACTAYFPKYVSYAHLMRRYNLARVQIRYDAMKIVDQHVPKPGELVSLVTRVIQYLSAGHKVFVHCAGGHGRTGLVVACVLLCLYDTSVDDVLHLVQSAHNMRRIQDKRCMHHVLPVRSPNSAQQVAFVRDFATFLRFARAL